MEALKDELNSEEKLFESAIRTERFVKRYKKPLLTLLSLAVLGGVGIVAYQTYAQNKLQSSNEALNKLLVNPQDKTAEATLQNDNPKLYELWKLSRAVSQKDVAALTSLSGSETYGVADIASYEIAAIQADPAKLEMYTKRQGALYKDLALIELAIHALEAGDIKSAHQKIGSIPEDSPLYTVAQSLMHYGVK